MSENPLSNVKPWDLVAEGYVTEVAPVFEAWARDGFKRVCPQPHHRVIDIATGPGTVALLVAPLVDEVLALDFSPNMIDQLNAALRARAIENVRTKICDCQSLPCESDLYDIAFSQFGLMFFPNRIGGFREMYRVLKASGQAAIYSWAPVSESPAMTMVMDALVAGFPETKPKVGINKNNEWP